MFDRPMGMIVFVIHSRLRRRWENEGARRVAAGLGGKHEVHVQFTLEQGHATYLARQAAASGAAVIVSVGGDGMLNEVVNGIMQWAEATSGDSGGDAFDSCCPESKDASPSSKDSILQDLEYSQPVPPPGLGAAGLQPTARLSSEAAAAAPAAAAAALHAPASETVPAEALAGGVELATLAVGGGAGGVQPVAPAAAAPAVLPAEQLPALGVLPWGTGNDFARTLGLRTADPLETLLAALLRPPTPIGVCHLTCQSAAADGQTVSRYFANVASCGASASAARHLPSLRRWGSALAYTLAGARALLSHRRLPVRVTLDRGDERIELKGSTLVAAGQGRCFAGGMQILPGADPMKGTLRILLLEGFGVFKFGLYQRRLRQGRMEGIKGVTLLTGTRLELLHTSDLRAGVGSPRAAFSTAAAPPAHLSNTAAHPRLWQEQEQGREDARRHLAVECDGEVVGCAPLVIEVLPGAIRLCIP